jgi:uncharacterized surface protein with fasciclin (FAS1) repeats
MKLNTITRTGSVAASLALLMGLGLSACGSEDTASGSEEAGAQTFGEGCKLIPADGAGSFNGMATAPVASAASANPLLKTLVTAVGEAELVDTLNSADALTVFAPTDDAFKKIPKADLDAVLADKATLTKVLTHHVVAGQLSPDEVAGEHETLAGDKITVEGSDDEFTVGKESAKVLCGNIPTANATVYVIDTVLMP